MTWNMAPANEPLSVRHQPTRTGNQAFQRQTSVLPPFSIVFLPQFICNSIDISCYRQQLILMKS